MITIKEAINLFLESIELSRSSNTARTYRNAMNFFENVLQQHKINSLEAQIDTLPEKAISWLSDELKEFSSSTEQLYMTAVHALFKFVLAEGLTNINLHKIELLIRQRSRKPGQRLPQFPREAIEQIVNYAINLKNISVDNELDLLINYRDRAFILTLADTGLRVHEACNLIRGDIDWNEAKAIVIGKGNRQAIIRFSSRSLQALRDYLNIRMHIDGMTGKQLGTLPLFARHDRGSGKRIKRITTTTGRNIITRRVKEALGENAIGTITPHSFRHYFVTTVLRASGNLKLAQELARHKSISITQRYAHLSDDELDKGYWDIFEQNQKTDSK